MEAHEDLHTISILLKFGLRLHQHSPVRSVVHTRLSIDARLVMHIVGAQYQLNLVSVCLMPTSVRLRGTKVRSLLNSNTQVINGPMNRDKKFSRRGITHRVSLHRVVSAVKSVVDSVA